jgi:aarF domain-containing kinase
MISPWCLYDFNFSLPPDYALVIRALGSLEETTKALDPDFKVIESAYPFVIGMLLADPSPDMRKILREFLTCDDGSIRWNRLERLVCNSELFCFHVLFLFLLELCTFGSYKAELLACLRWHQLHGYNL